MQKYPFLFFCITLRNQRSHGRMVANNLLLSGNKVPLFSNNMPLFRNNMPLLGKTVESPKKMRKKLRKYLHNSEIFRTFVSS